MASDGKQKDVDLKRGVYRLQYSGFLEGKRINHVSARSEMAFWRFQAIADDFGNFTADPVTLRGKAFARRQITPKAIGEILAELSDPEPYGRLIALYEAEGDRWAHIVGWEVLQPANRNGRRIERCPRHPEAADDPLKSTPGESGGIRGNPGSPSRSCASDSDSDSDSGLVCVSRAGDDEFPPAPSPMLSGVLTPILLAYPEAKRVAKNPAMRAIRDALDSLKARGEPDPAGWLLARVEAFAASPVGRSRFAPNAAKWFADGRYDDPDSAWQEASDGRHGGGGGAGGGAAGGGASRIELNHARRTHGQYPESLDIPE